MLDLRRFYKNDDAVQKTPGNYNFLMSGLQQIWYSFSCLKGRIKDLKHLRECSDY